MFIWAHNKDVKRKEREFDSTVAIKKVRDGINFLARYIVGVKSNLVTQHNASFIFWGNSSIHLYTII